MRWLIFASAAFLLIGCQAPDESVAKTAPTGPASDTTQKDQVPLPDFEALGDSSLALRVWGHDVKVGDSLDQVSSVFPDTRRALEISDLPPRFSNAFRARVWEKGDDGFGVILYKGQVCAAFASFDKTDEGRLTDLVRGEEAALGHTMSQDVDTGHTRYWFSDDSKDGSSPKERVMICAYRDPHDGLKVTASIGTVPAMDALGASPKAAKVDATHVEELLSQGALNKGGKP